MFRSIARALSAVGRHMRDVVRDVTGLAGAGLVSYGAWMIYPPAGYIVAGILCMVIALLSGTRPGNQ